jgi:hypothetical protein
MQDAQDKPFEEKLIRRDITSLYMLHGVLQEARAKVDAAFQAGGFDQWEDSAFWAKGLLIQARKILESDPIQGWRARHVKESLQLVSEATDMKVRVLKEYAFTGGLAPAGGNRSRREAYMQGELRDERDLRHDIFGNAVLKDVELFVTWGMFSDGSFELVAQKPYGVGSFRKGAPASLVIPIATAPEEFRFQSSSSLAPLFISDDLEIRSKGKQIVSNAHENDGDE